MHYYFNGDYISDKYNIINVADRGFLLGDGVFTTLKSNSGKLLFFESHIRRLKHDANVIKINLQINYAEIYKICKQLLIKNSLHNQEAIIRITISRGVSGRGINLPSLSLQQPTLLIAAFPYKDNLGNSIKICSTSIIRNEKSVISQIKSLNYLEPILARDEAITNGYDDGLMSNTQGNITECSISNVFFLFTDGALITPPASDGLLPGIVRNEVISICKTIGVEIIKKSVSINDLDNCKAGFVTNSAFGIKLINHINNKSISVSETIIENIASAYNTHCTNFCG